MVVNTKSGNNTGHAIAVTTRSCRGGNASTSSQRQIVDDEQVVQEEEIPNNVVQSNDEVQIDIDYSVEETQEKVNRSRNYIIDIPEPIVQMAKAPLPKPPPPYPQRLAKKILKLWSKCPFMKSYKGIVTKKRSINFETIKVTHQVSLIVHSLTPKLEYSSAFMIPCIIGSAELAKALCDLGANINLMPYSVFKILGIGKPRPTSMRLKLNDRTMKRPLGVIEDVLV
ncbi:uncharacterized protein [Nicotiana sylvestris]|uniref:uncharacterized protein n=1 Tax=Nicotiana sylvestris TaxID=4096 RepID=UPI00388C9D38